MAGKAADPNGETFIESITQSTSGFSEITHPFACFRCPRRFPSWHALGGHQNAHKKERNEEQRLYNEQRLALKKQSPVTFPSPRPIVDPVVAVLNSYSPVGSNGGMVQMQSLGPQAPVFMAGGFEYGPTTGECWHQEIGNSHGYNKGVNREGMALNLFPPEERDLEPFAAGREDAGADESIANVEEEVDLTLRL
ncbi:hypothetical protein V6N13_007770 [Hibiscus sabdariffa]|uniref:C2H2-type domain-containing protein n=1 Tax=Hibiscus sabdariffa TaxID=183260 RepID=A0ABR2EMQ1_9ROSI